MSKPSFLPTSLELLSSITKRSYNDSIAPSAMAVWEKHLNADNPLWNYVTAQPFSISDDNRAAHVMAMIDERLPEIGIVGYFGCTDSQCGSLVLRQAADWLKQQGFKNVYGPINGTLPSDYRINLNDDFMIPGEPVNPSWHLEAFKQAGFKVFNRYVSGESKRYQLLMKLFSRKPAKRYSHISVRPFDLEKQEKDFETYHELRNSIFPFQSVYCPPISIEERAYNLGDKKPLLNPKYTYFLEDGGKVVGFVLSYPHNNRLVVKTLGLLPAYRGKRLSELLIRAVHDQADRDGLEAAVYAMIRVGNVVYKMKRPGVKVTRKYVTMRKKL